MGEEVQHLQGGEAVGEEGKEGGERDKGGAVGEEVVRERKEDGEMRREVNNKEIINSLGKGGEGGEEGGE